MTYWRYTSNTKGSISGTKPTGRNIRAGVAHCQTPVKHLLVGGHCGEYGGGVPMAVKAAANASLIVMKMLAPNSYREFRNLLNGVGKQF
jgi:prolycopene isomerase